MKKTKSKTEASVDWAKLLAKPVTIDGVKVKDDELAEFLDWSFVNNSNDFKMFRHLKRSGYFDENPITPESLAAAHTKKLTKKNKQK